MFRQAVAVGHRGELDASTLPVSVSTAFSERNARFAKALT